MKKQKILVKNTETGQYEKFIRKKDDLDHWVYAHYVINKDFYENATYWIKQGYDFYDLVLDSIKNKVGKSIALVLEKKPNTKDEILNLLKKENLITEHGQSIRKAIYRYEWKAKEAFEEKFKDTSFGEYKGFNFDNFDFELKLRK